MISTIVKVSFESHDRRTDLVFHIFNRTFNLPNRHFKYMLSTW